LKEEDPLELRWLLRAQLKRKGPNRTESSKLLKRNMFKKANKKQIYVQKLKKKKEDDDF